VHGSEEIMLPVGAKDRTSVGSAKRLPCQG